MVDGAYAVVPVGQAPVRVRIGDVKPPSTDESLALTRQRLEELREAAAAAADAFARYRAELEPTTPWWTRARRRTPEPVPDASRLHLWVRRLGPADAPPPPPAAPR
jgi:hypothetical protein